MGPAGILLIITKLVGHYGTLGLCKYIIIIIIIMIMIMIMIMIIMIMNNDNDNDK